MSDDDAGRAVPNGTPVRFTFPATLTILATVTDDGTVTVYDSTVTPNQTVDVDPSRFETARGEPTPAQTAALVEWFTVNTWHDVAPRLAFEPSLPGE